MNVEIVYEVAWDGTRARNPYLNATPEVPQTQPSDAVSIAQQVIDALRYGGLSMRRLVTVTEGSKSAVNSALDRLQKLGYVRVEGTGWNSVRKQTEAIYGLTEKGRHA